MAQLSAVLCVLNSVGVRADAAMKTAAGDYPPVMLKCDANITATATRNGPYTEITLAVSTAAIVSSYVVPTGSGGSAGLALGRWDTDVTGGAIPGALSVRNDDGTDYSFVVDNGGALTSSAWSFQVGGAAGAMLHISAIDLPIQGSAPASPSSGFQRAYATATAMSIKSNAGIVRKVDTVRVRSVTNSDSPVTALDGDAIFADSTGGAISVVVPVASGARVEVYRLISNMNAVVLSCTGTVNGQATVNVPVQNGAVCRGDGTNVWAIGA